MVPESWVNADLANVLLPDVIKPLPEAMITNHPKCPMTPIWDQFYNKCPSHQFLELDLNDLSKNYSYFPKTSEQMDISSSLTRKQFY